MNSKAKPQRRLLKRLKQNKQGFILIETLVAVIVLAIGLLGMAAMQVVGLKNNNSAYTRTQATYLAYDMIDRIRNNTGGDYALVIGSTPATNVCSFTVVTSTLNCSESELANFDKTTWLADITNTLPGGQGGIAVAVDGKTYTITIRWLDKQGATTANQQVSLAMSVVI